MNIKTNKQSVKFLLLSLVILSLALFSESSFAASTDTLEGVAQNVSSQISSYAKLALGISFLAGIVVFAISLFKLKEKSQNPQVKMSSIFIMWIVSACLVGLPTVITLTTNTVFGTSHDSSDTAGSNYDRIK